MYESGELAICKYCKSFIEGKCTDCFEPGVLYPCINFLERKNEDRRNDDRH